MRSVSLVHADYIIAAWANALKTTTPTSRPRGLGTKRERNALNNDSALTFIIGKADYLIQNQPPGHLYIYLFSEELAQEALSTMYFDSYGHLTDHMGNAGDRVAEASSLLFDFARERGRLYQCEDCNEEYLPSPFVFLAAPPSDYSFSVRVLCQTLRESFSAIFGEDAGFMADYGYDPNSGETSALRLNDFIMSEAFHAGILDLYENGLVDAFREFAPQNPIGDPRDNPGTSH